MPANPDMSITDAINAPASNSDKPARASVDANECAEVVASHDAAYADLNEQHGSLHPPGLKLAPWCDLSRAEWELWDRAQDLAARYGFSLEQRPHDVMRYRLFDHNGVYVFGFAKLEYINWFLPED